MLPVEKFLSELIALPSVNPMFPVANADWTGEQRVADFLAHQADRLGLEVQIQRVHKGRSNVLLRLVPPGGKAQRRVLLVPHMDTVTVSGERHFKPVKKNGRLYGRGACDTKGSIAAMFGALGGIALKGPRPKQTEIILAAMVDEECGQTGSRRLAKSRMKADLAIVGEPTMNKLVTAHKGDFWLLLETRGKAAHGSKPELGKNAIHEMARVVDLLETRYAADLHKRRHPLPGHATVTVGLIRGGQQPNIVPDECAIRIDRRTLPGETRASIEKELNSLFRKQKLKVTISDAKTDLCWALETNADLPLVKDFMGRLRQKKPLGVDYFCDAAVLANGGIPSVVYGPGDIAQAHTEDEWISLQSLEKAVDQLGQFLCTLP